MTMESSSSSSSSSLIAHRSSITAPTPMLPPGASRRRDQLARSSNASNFAVAADVDDGDFFQKAGSVIYSVLSSAYRCMPISQVPVLNAEQKDLLSEAELHRRFFSVKTRELNFTGCNSTVPLFQRCVPFGLLPASSNYSSSAAGTGRVVNVPFDSIIYPSPDDLFVGKSLSRFRRITSLVFLLQEYEHFCLVDYLGKRASLSTAGFFTQLKSLTLLLHIDYFAESVTDRTANLTAVLNYACFASLEELTLEFSVSMPNSTNCALCLPELSGTAAFRRLKKLNCSFDYSTTGRYMPAAIAQLANQCIESGDSALTPGRSVCFSVSYFADSQAALLPANSLPPQCRINYAAFLTHLNITAGWRRSAAAKTLSSDESAISRYLLAALPHMVNLRSIILHLHSSNAPSNLLQLLVNALPPTVSLDLFGLVIDEDPECGASDIAPVQQQQKRACQPTAACTTTTASSTSSSSSPPPALKPAASRISMHYSTLISPHDFPCSEWPLVTLGLLSAFRGLEEVHLAITTPGGKYLHLGDALFCHCGGLGTECNSALEAKLKAVLPTGATPRVEVTFVDGACFM